MHFATGGLGVDDQIAVRAVGIRAGAAGVEYGTSARSDGVGTR